MWLMTSTSTKVWRSSFILNYRERTHNVRVRTTLIYDTYKTQVILDVHQDYKADFLLDGDTRFLGNLYVSKEKFIHATVKAAICFVESEHCYSATLVDDTVKHKEHTWIRI